MGARWGPAELEQLRTRWEAGATAAQIALDFGDGRTRNAIIGKVHALGLPARPKRPKAERPKGLRNVRKAYASKGDDTTFSRFVKVKAKPGEPRHLPRRQWKLPGIDKGGGSIQAGRSIFHAKGTRPADGNVLVSGHSNIKIGRDVRVGPLKGYWIYTLSLEERATCPTTCHHWRTCYGNNMPFVKRVDHRDPAKLEAALEANIERLLRVRGRAGILVRLHALGDFFDVPYVQFWRRMLARHPRLAVYGYTARELGTPIGDALASVAADYGPRFAMRWSNGGRDTWCTVPIRSVDERVNAIVCPEQVGKLDGCGKCGICWLTPRNIAFIEH